MFRALLFDVIVLGLHTYAHKHTRTRAHVLTHVPANIRVCVLGGGGEGVSKLREKCKAHVQRLLFSRCTHSNILNAKLSRRRGASTKYPQHTFSSRDKKK